jgi:hypothetical protein
MVLTIFMMEMEFGNQVYMCVYAVCAERILAGFMEDTSTERA